LTIDEGAAIYKVAEAWFEKPKYQIPEMDL